MPKLSFVRLFLLFFAALFLLTLNVAAQSAGADARATVRAKMVEFLRYVELEKNVSPADVDGLVELWMSASRPELSLEARRQAFSDLYTLYYKAHGVDLSGRPQAGSALAQSAAAFMQSGARLDLRLPTPRGPLAGDYLHVATEGRGKERMLLIADGGIDGRELYRSFVTRHKDRYTMHIVTLPGAGSAKMMPWPEVYDLTRRPWINHIEQSLQALLAKIAKDKLVVIGTAVGGYFAARLALTKPEKVRAVVLVDALVNIPMPSRGNPGKPATLKERLARMKTFIPAPSLFPVGEVPGRAEIGRLLNTPNNTHPTVQNWMAFAVKDEALSKAWTLEALSNGFFAPGLRFGFELQTTDLTEDLKQLAVPMLAMCATPDAGSPRVSATGPPLLSATGWQEVKSLYPHIPLSVALYHDTRSYISEDRPREFDRDLSDFLAGRPVAGIAAPGSAPAQKGGGAADNLSEEIIALERSAFDRWIKGDPQGYLDLYAPEVAYFDPFREKRVDGLEAMKTLLAPLKETKSPIKDPRYEMIDPKIQRYGDVALLTFNLISYGKLSDQPEAVLARWNATEVYCRTDGKWKIIHSHWSFIGTPARGFLIKPEHPRAKR